MRFIFKKSIIIVILLTTSLPSVSIGNPVSFTAWGPWRSISCFPQIKYRVKYNETATDRGKREYKVQFHNTFNENIYFSYAMVPYSERSAIESSGNTTNRTDLNAGEMSGDGVSAHWTYLATSGEIYVHVNKLRFSNDAGEYAQCGDTHAREKKSVSKNTPPDTEQCIGCGNDQFNQNKQSDINQKKQEQQEKENAEKIAQEKKQAEIDVIKAKEQEQKEQFRKAEADNYDSELEKIRQQERAEKQEQERKAQEYQQRQIQTKENMNKAAEMSVAALLLHFYFGKILYAIENDDPKARYQEWASDFNVHFGYQISNHNIYVNERTITYGNNSTRIADATTLDLGFGMEWSPLHSKNVGFSTFADIYGGHGFLFTHFKWGYAGGFKTHLGPIAYNYRINGVEVFHDNWIDADLIAEEKAKSTWGRHEVGIARKSSGINFDILWTITPKSPFVQEEKYLHGVRVEIYKSNGLRFFTEFSESENILGKRNQAAETLRTPTVFQIGVWNNLNWFGTTYANNYDKKVLFKHLDKKTWYLSFSMKQNSGDIMVGSGEFVDTLSRTYNDYNYQALIEKEFKIIDNMYLSVGAGGTIFRGFDGVYTYKIAPDNPINESNTINFNTFTADFPIGIMFNSEPIGNYHYSIIGGVKADLTVPVAYNPPTFKDELGFNEKLDEDGFNEIKKSFYVMYKAEFGFEYYISTKQKFRWTLLYEFPTNSIFEAPVQFYPNGFGLKASISL